MSDEFIAESPSGSDEDEDIEINPGDLLSNEDDDDKLDRIQESITFLMERRPSPAPWGVDSGFRRFKEIAEELEAMRSMAITRLGRIADLLDQSKNEAAKAVIMDSIRRNDDE